MDDFHRANETFEERVKSLQELLDKGRELGVQWRLSKCRFCHPEVTLTGFNVSAKGKTLDPAKVEALKKSPSPTCLVDVASQFAVANYLREFIPRFVGITQPLKKYKVKEVHFKDYDADKAAQNAANELRSAVATQCPLVNPVYDTARDYINTATPFCLLRDA